MFLGTIPFAASVLADLVDTGGIVYILTDYVLETVRALVLDHTHLLLEALLLFLSLDNITILLTNSRQNKNKIEWRQN